MGGLAEIEEPMVEGKILRSLLRMKVTLDMKQPLTTRFCVLQKEKKLVWVWLKYEKL